jgi:hypothetical protein
MNCRSTHDQDRWLSRLAACFIGIALILGTGACSQDPKIHGADPSIAKLKVTSTLDGLTALPHRIHWQAFPAPLADITEVDFLIDGKQLWVEHGTPYFYGGDYNYLVTSFLSRGAHTFTVRAIDVSGDVATDTVTATVPSAPRPPVALAGTWKASAPMNSDPTSCSPGPCPLAGYWRLVISPIGWQVYDTSNGGALYDVRYLSSGMAEIRTGMDTGHGNYDGNAWCNNNAGRPVRVHWTVSGNLLSFTPVGSQAGSCGFTAFLKSPDGHRPGSWTKVGS